MAESEANDLAEVLALAAAAVAGIANAPQARHTYRLVDELQRRLLVPRRSLPTTAVPSNVRQAAVALAHELQAANKALKPRVLAAEEQRRAEVELEPRLPMTLCVLQSLANLLISKFDVVPFGDADLAFRVMAAGVITVDLCAVACRVWPSQLGPTHASALSSVVGNLDLMSTLDEGHTQSLKVLRATTFTPEVILTALRRLLSCQAPPGVLDADLPRIIDILEAILRGSCFAAEQAAVEREPPLQASIVAILDESIRRFVGLSGAASMDTAVYIRTCKIIQLLVFPELREAKRERAARNPAGFFRLLSACFDLILERPPPEDEPLHIDEAVKAAQRLALSCWSLVAYDACSSDDHSGGPPPLTDTLSCVQQAAAAALLLSQPGLDEHDQDGALQGLFLLMRRIPGFYYDANSMSHTADAMRQAAGSTDAELHALLLSLMAALEGITRVAAQLPARWKQRYLAAEEGTTSLRAAFRVTTGFILLCSMLCVPASKTSIAGSQAAMMAAAGMVESLGKFALVTAGRAAGAAQSEALASPKVLHDVMDMMVAACLHMIIKMVPDMINSERAVEGATMKRWQGVALAAYSTVAALAESGTPAPCWQPQFENLLLSLVTWPGINGLLPEVPVGQSAVHHVLMGILEDLGDGGMQPERHREACELLKHFFRSEVATDLARRSVLSQLASWAELQCGKSPSDGRQEVLLMIRDLVERVVRSSDAAAAQAAHSLIAEGSADASSAAHWRRLRVEVVEPLEVALGARAGTENDPAQLAVDVAEALATRACAHVGCTTVVGASEAAAPRGKRCGGCRLVRYCGAACQKADWAGHKAACRELRRRGAGG